MSGRPGRPPTAGTAGQRRLQAIQETGRRSRRSGRRRSHLAAPSGARLPRASVSGRPRGPPSRPQAARVPGQSLRLATDAVTRAPGLRGVVPMRGRPSRRGSAAMAGKASRRRASRRAIGRIPGGAGALPVRRPTGPAGRAATGVTAGRAVRLMSGRTPGGLGRLPATPSARARAGRYGLSSQAGVPGPMTRPCQHPAVGQVRGSEGLAATLRSSGQERRPAPGLSRGRAGRSVAALRSGGPISRLRAAATAASASRRPKG